MTNVTTVDLVTISGSSTVNTINNNIHLLRDEFEKPLYADGRKALTANLDANSNRIINGGAPQNPTDFVRLVDISGITKGDTGPAGPTGSLLAYTLEQFGGGVSKTKAENATAWNIAQAAIYMAGGGTIEGQAGTYNIGAISAIPNDAATGVATKQASIRITGQGGFSSGQDRATAGGTRFLFDNNPALPARIHSLGLGQLSFDHCTCECGDTNSQPLLLVSGTSLYVDPTATFVGHSSFTGTSCIQDMILLGGTATTPPANIIGQGATNAFQGYGTYIGAASFFRCRRAIYGRVYANAITIMPIWVGHNCGTNLANGAAIELDGDPLGATQNITGATIFSPVVESGSYAFAIKARMVQQCKFMGGNSYDGPVGVAINTLYLDPTTALLNLILGGTEPGSGQTYLNSNYSKSNTYISISQNQPLSNFSAISAGNPAQHNLLAETDFSFGPIITANGNGGSNFCLTMRNLAGTNQFKWQANGLMLFEDPASALSGNVSVAAPGQAEYWNQGRGIGFNGRSGGAMEINTGTGGSVLKLQAAYTNLTDQTGAAGYLYSGGNKLLGPRASALPAAATDLATAITLLNAMRSAFSNSTGGPHPMFA